MDIVRKAKGERKVKKHEAEKILRNTGCYHNAGSDVWHIPDHLLMPAIEALCAEELAQRKEAAQVAAFTVKALTEELAKRRDQKPFCFATPVSTMGHDWTRAVFFSERNEAWKATVPLYAAPAPAVPSVVFMAHNKTSNILFAAHEDAEQYAVGFGPAAGVTVTECAVIGSQSAPQAPAVPKYCKECRDSGAIHCSDPENCRGPWDKRQAVPGDAEALRKDSTMLNWLLSDFGKHCFSVDLHWDGESDLRQVISKIMESTQPANQNEVG